MNDEEDNKSISGVDFMLRSAFLTELSNLNACEETHTDQDIIVINYLKKRIKQINDMKTQ